MTAPTVDRGRLIHALHERYARPRLRIGAIGYPPFTTLNGKASGPMYECLEEAAVTLDVDTEMVRCTWDDFDEKIISGEVDVVPEPVMPTARRNVDIIAYCKLAPAAIVFPLRKSRAVRERISALRERTTFRALRKIIHELSSIAGQGLAVTKGTLEHELCDSFSCQPRLYDRHQTIVENVVQACNDGCFALAEWPSALEAVDLLGRSYDLMPLLGDATAPAGFAVHPMDENLQEFLSTFIGVGRALERIDASVLSKMKIQLYPEIGRFPVISGMWTTAFFQQQNTPSAEWQDVVRGHGDGDRRRDPFHRTVYLRDESAAPKLGWAHIVELINQARSTFSDVAERVICLDRLNKALEGFIHEANLGRKHGSYGSMVLTMLSIAIRKHGAAALSPNHFEAISFSIECLHRENLSLADVEDCGRLWDRAGAEPVPSVEEYIEILEEENAYEFDEDVIPGNHDPDSQGNE